MVWRTEKTSDHPCCYNCLEEPCGFSQWQFELLKCGQGCPFYWTIFLGIGVGRGCGAGLSLYPESQGWELAVILLFCSGDFKLDSFILLFSFTFKEIDNGLRFWNVSNFLIILDFRVQFKNYSLFRGVKFESVWNLRRTFSDWCGRAT